MRERGAASTHQVPTALYRCYDALGRLLYVGITNAGAGRWTKHGHESSWWPATARIELEHYATRVDAEEAEKRIICALQPMHNVQHATYAACSECGARMRWVDLDTPQAVFVHEGRTFQGSWLCERCIDYPYAAPPLSAALPEPAPKPVEIDTSASRELIKAAYREAARQ